MPVFSDSKKVPYSADQMFELVANIEQYPEFLPWVEGVRIRKSDLVEGSGERVADLIVGFKMFRERFASKVVQDREALTVTSYYLDGPFTHLENYWTIEETEDGCIVHVKTDYEFKNRILQMAATQFVDFAFKQLSSAFVKRADEVYG